MLPTEDIQLDIQLDPTVLTIREHKATKCQTGPFSEKLVNMTSIPPNENWSKSI